MHDDTRRADRYGELWRVHAVGLLRYATLLVGPNDAADIVSTAFERAARVERLVDDQRRYLIRAVTNLAIDQARSRRRRQARELKAAAVTVVPAHESNVDVRRAVAGLSVQQRVVVYFAYWEDLDSNEIAAVLEISSATVRRRLARARAQLRKVLS